MNGLAYLKMVLWSFFGIRRRAAAGQELTKANPLALVAVALGAAAGFVCLLVTLARLAAGH